LKILGIDIGAGTKDVLLYDSEKNIENCIKMVLPSPTLLFAKKVGRVESDLYIDGNAIGGGALAIQLKKHILEGHRVFMSEEAAFTLYNRLDRVRSLGITIVEKPLEGFHGEYLTLDEVNIEQLRSFISSYMEPLDDLEGIAISVQDHGIPVGDIGQNKFRLIKFKEHFTRNPRIQSVLFSGEQTPDYYYRMKSAVRSVKKSLPNSKVFMMDSTIAAIAGCLHDKPESSTRQITAVNIGNSHVTAALIDGDSIIGLMEHHTSLLEPRKLERYLERLRLGILTDNEVTGDGGHGVFYLSTTEDAESTVIVTGPNRMMISEAKLKIHFANPSGDIMMTGAYGLVKAVEKRMMS